MNDNPIGVFDSGVGGVSVLKDIKHLLPYEHLLYVADSAWCPYGGRSAHDIRLRTQVITEWLLDQGVKLIVVACNTATIAAVEWLRATYPLAFVGMEPAVKPAVQQTKSGVVGVLATGASLAGEKFHHLLSRYAGDVRVLTQPCPGLVECVESGELLSLHTKDLLTTYVMPLVDQGADTLVLGCTHYPFLKPLIYDIVGPDIQIIDTGEAVARRVAQLLEFDHLQRDGGYTGSVRWFTSGDPSLVQPTIASLWGQTVNVEQGPS